LLTAGPLKLVALGHGIVGLCLNPARAMLQLIMKLQTFVDNLTNLCVGQRSDWLK